MSKTDLPTFALEFEDDDGRDRVVHFDHTGVVKDYHPDGSARYEPPEVGKVQISRVAGVASSTDLIGFPEGATGVSYMRIGVAESTDGTTAQSWVDDEVIPTIGEFYKTLTDMIRASEGAAR